MFGYIYKTTNLINGRAYIGKRSSPVFDTIYYGSGILLEKAIVKYGKENFSIEILEWANDECQLNLLEVKYISLYKSHLNLYNIAKGGAGGDTTTSHPHRDEVIAKRASGISKWHQQLSESEKTEYGAKISSAKKGNPNGHAGLMHTDETKEKMSRVSKDYTKSVEWRAAQKAGMASRRGIPTANSIPILINGVTYPSLSVATTQTGISKYKLRKMI